MHADSGRRAETETKGEEGGEEETRRGAGDSFSRGMPYVQGVNASETVNMFTARTKTHPP